MIQLSNISLSFGGQELFKDLTWTIKPDVRTGLIGPNGAGKSTLLRLITEALSPDSGTISKGSSFTIGYLEQDVYEFSPDSTVLDVALEAFKRVQELEIAEKEITEQLKVVDHESDHYEKLLHSLDDIHVEMNQLEAHISKPRAERILMGLGFEADELNRPLSNFSGGWRMRAALAKLLLEEPSFLLLDEPTNHLDIDSIDWLETYLKDYKGSVIIVSHDRYFLDRMVNHIAEIRYGKIVEYAGNYTFYLEDKKEREVHHRAMFENQQREIAQAERFIERFRAKASKARQVQSRIKALERLERVPPPDEHSESISFRFAEPERSGKVVASLSQFSKSYSSKEGVTHVFVDAGPLQIERGDKIALIGVNGAGKSTLARILNGEEPFDGSLEFGYNVTRTFFAQHQADSLNRSRTVLESLEDVARGQSETELRSLLGTFLFTGDDVFKKVSVLSGGEKSRLALARTLLKPSNFLILDEPTNHLDIQSIAVLVEALKQYSGTFIVVSHDRHFLDQVANKVFRVGRGTVRTFIGNFTDYKWQVEHGTAAVIEGAEQSTSSPSREKSHPKNQKKTREQKRLEAEERQRLSKLISQGEDIDYGRLSTTQLERLYSKTEQKIFKAERKQRKLEQLMSDPEVFSDLQQARTLTSDYESLKSDIADLYVQWEEIATLLEDHTG